MTISIQKDKILNAILIAERITGKKETLPILSCVLIKAEKDVLIQATNLEAGVEVHVPCDVGEKGTVAVPVSILSQTIKSIGGDKVSFKVEGGNLVVESRGTHTLIKAVPHSEFPTIPATSRGKEIKVLRNNLIQGLQAVSYAASPSMIRPELGSVYMAIKGGNLTCVATDSFRLAEKMVRSGKGEEGPEILIPLKHAVEIVHTLEKLEVESVSLTADDSQLTVTADGIRYISRVIDGTFPSYADVIPKSFGTEVTLLKNDFSETLKKARVFSGGDQNIGLHAYPKKKVFTATAQNADVGEMSDSIDAAVSGEDVDINFHIGYLADCLSSIASDSITLGFSGAGKPLVIRGVSDPTFTYLVMPLNR